jgi:hypothetical protein
MPNGTVAPENVCPRPAALHNGSTSSIGSISAYASVVNSQGVIKKATYLCIIHVIEME